MGLKTKLLLTTEQEIKPNMIEPMKAKQSLKAAELQDGDIVCFQKADGAKSPDADRELVFYLPHMVIY
jgi:ubiquitin carboxyl-terminal hydrolase 7